MVASRFPCIIPLRIDSGQSGGDGVVLSQEEDVQGRQAHHLIGARIAGNEASKSAFNASARVRAVRKERFAVDYRHQHPTANEFAESQSFLFR